MKIHNNDAHKVSIQKIDSQNKYLCANQGIKSARAGSKRKKGEVAGTRAFMGFGGGS